MKVIFLSDHNITYDQRVQTQMDALIANKKILLVRSKSNSVNDKHYFQFLLFLFLESFKGFLGFFKIKRILRNLNFSYKILHYSFFYSIYYFFKQSVKLIDLIEKEMPDLIVANDLSCGAVAAYCNKKFGIKYYYDSHEVQIFRNYKNNLLRCSISYGIELSVIKNATKYCTVNNKILELYYSLYGVYSYIVVNNFPHKLNITIKKQSHFDMSVPKINLIYFGHVNSNRGMQYTKLFDKIDCIENIIFYTNLKNTRKTLQNLKECHKTKFNDMTLDFSTLNFNNTIGLILIEKNVLSYKLSLPNKFFQYLYCGLPMLVLEDTYLASLIRQFNLGIVLRPEYIVEDFLYGVSKLQEIYDNFSENREKCLDYFSKYTYNNFFKEINVAQINMQSK